MVIVGLAWILAAWLDDHSVIRKDQEKFDWNLVIWIVVTAGTVAFLFFLARGDAVEWGILPTYAAVLICFLPICQLLVYVIGKLKVLSGFNWKRWVLLLLMGFGLVFVLILLVYYGETKWIVSWAGRGANSSDYALTIDDTKFGKFAGSYGHERIYHVDPVIAIGGNNSMDGGDWDYRECDRGGPKNACVKLIQAIAFCDSIESRVAGESKDPLVYCEWQRDGGGRGEPTTYAIKCAAPLPTAIKQQSPSAKRAPASEPVKSVLWSTNPKDRASFRCEPRETATPRSFVSWSAGGGHP